MMDFEATARIRDLERELAAAQAQAAESEQNYLRCRAEMDNFRKRLERSHAEQGRSDKKALLVKALGVLDNLQRAIDYEHTAKDDPKQLIEGLRLTYWQMQEMLTSEGLKPIEAVGEVFDPHMHEAVDIDVSGRAKPGVITSELQKGYYFGDEVLRPARVRVAAAVKRRTA
jgi:molecular chaperone GrpE